MIRQRTSRLWAYVVAAVAILVLSGIGGYLIALYLPAAVAPAPTSAPTPTVSPSSAPTVEPVQQAMPSSCESIYSPDLTTFLTGAYENHVLHEGQWTGAESFPREPFMADLISDETLACSWEESFGGTGTGEFMETSVTPLTTTESAELLRDLRGAGYSCFPAQQGSLCVLTRELETDYGSGPISELAWSDSHFIRDGLWVQTQVEGRAFTFLMIDEGMPSLIIDAISPQS